MLSGPAAHPATGPVPGVADPAPRAAADRPSTDAHGLLTVSGPLLLLVSRAQLEALDETADVWSTYGAEDISEYLEVPTARGVAARWRNSFAALATKVARALGRCPRRDGRFAVELSANQATRLHTALQHDLVFATICRDADAPVAAWGALHAALEQAATAGAVAGVSDRAGAPPAGGRRSSPAVVEVAPGAAAPAGMMPAAHARAAAPLTLFDGLGAADARAESPG